MRIETLFLSLLFCISYAFAQTSYTVTTPGMFYAPDTINCNVGDTINFILGPSHNAVEVDQATVVSSQTSSQPTEDKVDIAALIAMGDIATGEKVFKKCAACHSIVKGGKNNIGPALYNVVGRDVGAVGDYKYSKALASYGKAWTFEELNGYLLKPAKWIKGTKMAFAGLRKEKDRASVILYLNQNSDNPLPLP